MKKSDWYEDRILWRAAKHHLDSCLWRNFFLSNEQAAGHISKKTAGYGAPLIIFWLNDETWTMVTSQFLVGEIKARISVVNLDMLGEMSTVNDTNLPPNELKQSAEYIKAGADEKIFWTPRGNNHFSLLNILRVFPLNVPE